MIKLTFDDAKQLLKQIKDGIWLSELSRSSGEISKSREVYRLDRGDIYLWVGGGLLHLELRHHNGHQFIKIPLFLKVYLWFRGVRKFALAKVTGAT